MTIQISRRALLQASAAGLALGTLNGCATTSTGPSIGRVVVIGGGYGGATAAKYLRLWGGNIDVTLVERNEQFISCPMSNLVVGGYKQLSDITLPYTGLAQHGVKVVRGEVTAIDPDKKMVRLADGTALPYDRVIVSPGIDFMFDQVGGLGNAVASGKIVHAWKAGPQTVALRKQLESMPDGGVFAIAIPKAPYRCPPGPYERAAVVASYFKQAKPHAKVLILDANPEIQSKKALFEKVYREQYTGIVEYRPNSELREVEAETTTAVLEFDKVSVNVLNVIPPQRAADLAKAAGLININGRWVGVDWLTMESQVVPGIHVLGDATFPAPLMPKSGHMANQHAKLAAAAVISLLKGEPVNPSPVVMNTCYSFVNAKDVIHVASVHQYNAAEKTFKTVPGSGGVSQLPSALEGKYANAWAQNIWADMLG